MSYEQNKNKKPLKLNRLRNFGLKYENYQLVKLVDELSLLQKKKEELEEQFQTLCSDDVAQIHNLKNQLQLLNEEIQIKITKIEQEEANTKKPKTVWVWHGKAIQSSLSKKQRRKLNKINTSETKCRYNGTVNDYSKAIHGPAYRANYKRGKTVIK